MGLNISKIYCTFDQLISTAWHVSSLVLNQFYSSIKSIPWLFSLNYTEACNKFTGPIYASLHPGDTAFSKNVAAVVSLWQHCIRFDRPKIWTLTIPPAFKTNAYPFQIILMHFKYLQVIAQRRNVLDEAQQKDTNDEKKRLDFLDILLETKVVWLKSCMFVLDFLKAVVLIYVL